MKRYVFILFFVYTFAVIADDNNHINKGNELYKNKKYSEAELEYRKSLDKKLESNTATYNLGNSLYKQNKINEAADKYLDITTKNLDKKTTAQAYHNLGNTYLKNKEYDKSINAFKNALKNDPKDNDTRYNLEYARKMLIQQQQQQQQQQNKQNQQQNKDKNKQNNDDKNKQDQNKDNKQDQNNQQKDNGENKENKQNQSNQQQKQKISKDEAERLLESIRNDEKNLQKDLKKKQKAAGKVKILKEW